MKRFIKITNNDGENGDVGNPYIYLPLYNGDIGIKDTILRKSKTEYINRKPFCISNFSTNGLTLNIANSGLVPSDLVMIEYQVVYCTASSHTATDGFTVSHAAEIKSDIFDSYQNIDYVPARSIISKQITFKQTSIFGLENIFFRAKVSTIWHPVVPIEKWNFASDITVVEGHLKIVT